LPLKAFVAMSGGVDSSVAALLLKERGFEVIGITMQIWTQSGESAGKCCALDEVNDAKRVARDLDIPHYVLNFRTQFIDKVIEPFCAEYLAGRTPNPCIACNRFIKFDLLLSKALAMGADYLATGHYARAVYNRTEDRFSLLTGVDIGKDQSYVLYNLTQQQLRHLLFPLGEMNKDQVRETARKMGLAVAGKAESQEICFVEDGDYGGFVEQYTSIKPVLGFIKDMQGNIIGKHSGIHKYTIGQRKGLGIAQGKPVYINKIDAETNTIWIGDNSDLWAETLFAYDVNYVYGRPFDQPQELQVKIRYASPAMPATVTSLPDNRIRIDFHKPQRAITPGQAAVFYRGEELLGGGTICLWGI
jgi:tRNA-specific 2-thiouridylase